MQEHSKQGRGKCPQNSRHLKEYSSQALAEQIMCCRINFLPSDRGSVPVIGKQSATWDRLKGDVLTHKVRRNRPSQTFFTLLML